MTPPIFRRPCIFIFLLLAAGLSSCFVSSRSNMEVFNKSEYVQSVSVKTIKVPLLISKPVIRNYLRFEEDVPKEITDLIGGLKKIRVTLAQTGNAQLIDDFRLAVKQAAGEEWLSVYMGKKWVYLKVDQNARDVIKRITLSVSAPEANQLVFVNMKCNLTPDQLNKLINFALNSKEGKKIMEEKEME